MGLLTDENYVDIQKHLSILDTKITTICKAQEMTTRLLEKQDDVREQQIGEIKDLIINTSNKQFIQCTTTKSECTNNFITKEIFYKAVAFLGTGIVGSFAYTSGLWVWVWDHIRKSI